MELNENKYKNEYTRAEMALTLINDLTNKGFTSSEATRLISLNFTKESSQLSKNETILLKKLETKLKKTQKKLLV